MKYVYKKRSYIFLASFIDAIGGILFSFRFVFKKPLTKNPQSILVVRLDHIGDFVCTTPVFKNLKKQFPGSKITVLINSASKELAYRDPSIDKVITFSPIHLARGDGTSTLRGLLRIIRDVRNIGFDLGIDPRGDILSIAIMWLGGVKYRVGYGITGGGFLLNRVCRYDKSKHVVDRNLALLEALDIPVSNRLPEVYFSKKDEDEVERLLRPVPLGTSCLGHRARNDGSMTGLERAVIIHPFAGAKAKEWPRENFCKLIERLKEDGYKVLLVGSKDDNGIFENTADLRGKLNLPQLACLIKSIGFFIGLDSGPANIAAALNVPSVIICSGTNMPQLWIPDNPNVRFVYKDVNCRPCELKVCRKKRHECMDQITVDEVFAKFMEIASPTPSKLGVGSQ